MTEILFARKDDIDLASTLAAQAAAAASAAAALASQTAAGTSATASATSATASASSATASAASAAAAATSATSTAKGGLLYNFASSTTMADPSAANIRFNNATLASVTALAISYNSADTGNPSFGAFLTAMGASTNTNKATLLIRKASAPENFRIYTITAAVTDNSTWVQVAVSHVVGSGSFSAADTLLFYWWRSGDAANMSGMAAHGIPVAATASSVTSSIAPIVGGVLTSTSASADPAFSATPTLGASGTLGSITLGNATSGLLTIQPVTGALGTVTVSLPAATDTLMGKATTDTITNKTFDTAGTGNVFKINGTGITDKTGTGKAVLDTSPTLVTPVLGVATATSINGLTLTTSTGTVTITNGKTLAVSNTLTFSGTDSSTLAVGVGGTLTGSSSSAIFYDNIPQNSKSAAYTTVLADAQKHIYHPSADTTARTFTIDSNANVAYPIGTAITFINDTSAGVLTIAITSDTLVQMGTGSTGSRTLAANGIATAIKVTSTRWVISGTGLT